LQAFTEKFDLTGKQREASRMKASAKKYAEFPKRLREGNTEVTIYRQSNPSRRLDPETDQWVATGKIFDEYVLAYYQGVRQITDKKNGSIKTLPKLVRQKFSDLAKAEHEARFILTKLVNGEADVLKLTGLDRAAYIHAVQKLSECRPDADLNNVVSDYVAAVKRLPAPPRCYEFCQERCGARLLFFFFLKAVFVFCPFRLGRDFETFSRLGAI
jgi:hypothetical protein